MAVVFHVLVVGGDDFGHEIMSVQLLGHRCDLFDREELRAKDLASAKSQSGSSFHTSQRLKNGTAVMVVVNTNRKRTKQTVHADRIDFTGQKPNTHTSIHRLLSSSIVDSFLSLQIVPISLTSPLAQKERNVQREASFLWLVL